MSKNLNLPNILALFRIALAPLMLWFFVDRNNTIFSSWHPSWFDYFAGLIFVIASVTDFFDGYIARTWDQMTKLGGILDPLADKMLVASGFILLATAGVIPAWMAVIIVLRDFFVTGLRNFGADNNKDLAASLTGKVKTVFQLLAIILALVGTYNFGDFVTQSLVMTPIELLINIGMSVSVAAAVLATVEILFQV